MKTRIFAACLILLFASARLSAQSPGLIVRPAGGSGITKLNPDGNGFASATTAGFKLRWLWLLTSGPGKIF